MEFEISSLVSDSTPLWITLRRKDIEDVQTDTVQQTEQKRKIRQNTSEEKSFLKVPFWIESDCQKLD